VIDHLSTPPIASKALEFWRGLIARVAEHRNVSCKISGMITEADQRAWTPGDLAPYVEHVFDCFGIDRVMFGSDWPVCLLAGSYAEVMNAVRAILGPQLDIAGTDRLFGANAARFYGLEDSR
jgi:L-fuconolactonase